MKTNRILLATLALLPLSLAAQERYMSRTGHASFFSETKMENIEAHNHKATAVFDASTGAIEMSMLIKAFEFEKALMQEHFNENYMESEKFPKATFKGTVSGLPAGALTKPGSFDVEVKGELTIHGVTRTVTEKARFIVDGKGGIKAECAFKVKPEDHGIKIPGAVRNNIAEIIEVKLDVPFSKM
ncbi:MAG: YceI family protein [Flavobacteriales bacterium]|nr:YceI family protein [Flavobacteriales bacterium]